MALDLVESLFYGDPQPPDFEESFTSTRFDRSFHGSCNPGLGDVDVDRSLVKKRKRQNTGGDIIVTNGDIIVIEDDSEFSIKNSCEPRTKHSPSLSSNTVLYQFPGFSSTPFVAKHNPRDATGKTPVQLLTSVSTVQLSLSTSTVQLSLSTKTVQLSLSTRTVQLSLY